MFSNSLPFIEIHATGHALQNKTYLAGYYARAYYFAEKSSK